MIDVPNKKTKTKLDCPFCDEGEIKVLKQETFNPSRRGVGGDFKMKMISTECSRCGKSESEIKDKLKKKGFPFS